MRQDCAIVPNATTHRAIEDHSEWVFVYRSQACPSTPSAPHTAGNVTLHYGHVELCEPIAAVEALERTEQTTILRIAR